MKNKPTKKPHTLTFRALVEPALEAKHLRRNEASSIHTDRTRLNRILPAIGRVPIRELTPARLERFLQDLARGDATHGPLKGSTLNRYHSLLSSIFRYAVRQGVMRSNPMALGTVPRAKESGIRVRYLGREEEERLRDVIRVDCPEKELELELAILTGMRRSEQFGAKWEDWRKDEGILSVTGKTGAREVQISPQACQCLERLRERAPADQIYITPEANSGKADRRTWFERAVKKAGLRPAFHVRDLRHTFASRLAAAGVPLLTIQQLTGHKSFSTTLRYAHVAPDMRKKAVAEVRLYPRSELADRPREGAVA